MSHMLPTEGRIDHHLDFRPIVTRRGIEHARGRMRKFAISDWKLANRAEENQ